MVGIQNLSENCQNLLSRVLISIEEEEADDNKFRQQYGPKWNRL